MRKVCLQLNKVLNTLAWASGNLRKARIDTAVAEAEMLADASYDDDDRFLRKSCSSLYDFCVKRSSKVDGGCCLKQTWWMMNKQTPTLVSKGLFPSFYLCLEV